MKQKESEEVGEKKRRGNFFKRVQKKKKKSGQELREYEECL